MCSWWTFAGARANAILASGLAGTGLQVWNNDNFRIVLDPASPSKVFETIRAFPDLDSVEAPIPDRLISELKFNECLPARIANRIISERQSDLEGARRILGMPTVMAVA